MPLEFKRSWSGEEVESFRDSWDLSDGGPTGPIALARAPS